MSFGKMNKIAYLKRPVREQDNEGFSHSRFETIASVRVYREGRHGTEKWSNLAAFSQATDLFRMRCIPGLTISTECFLLCDGILYDIESVEDVKGKGMYLEILAKRSETSIG